MAEKETYSRFVNCRILTESIQADTDIQAELLFINSTAGGSPQTDVWFERALTNDEKTALASLINAAPQGTGRVYERKYKVIEKSKGLVIKESFYYTDNGDGTYSDLVDETTYTYSNRKQLETKTQTIYDTDGVIINRIIIDFYDGDNNSIIEKIRRGD